MQGGYKVQMKGREAAKVSDSERKQIRNGRRFDGRSDGEREAALRRRKREVRTAAGRKYKKALANTRGR